MQYRLFHLSFRFLSTLMFGIAAAIAAADEAPVASGPTVAGLKQQVVDRQYAQAWDTALALRADNEGDPSYDLLFGIAAYENKHYYEAQYALERVVYAEPENMYARFELAKTYQQLGDTASAQREFKLVQASNPPADVAREVDQYLNGGHKTLKSSFVGYVEAGLGYDNNINRSSSLDVVTVPTPWIPPQPLIAAGREQSDWYDSLIGSFQYFQPLKDDLGVVGKFRVSEKNYFSSSDFDETIYDLNASLNQKLGDHLLKLSIYGQNYRLDGASRTNTIGGDGTWEYQVLKNTGVAAGAGYNRLRYPDGNGLLDVNQEVIHAAMSQHVGNQYHTLGVMKTLEMPVNDNSPTSHVNEYNARDSWIVYYDLNWYLNARHSIQLRLMREDMHHGARDPVWLVERNDRMLDALASWQWRFTNNLLLDTHMGGTRNYTSSLPVYNYNRAFVETGIRYTF